MEHAVAALLAGEQRLPQRQQQWQWALARVSGAAYDAVVWLWCAVPALDHCCPLSGCLDAIGSPCPADQRGLCIHNSLPVK